MRAAVVGLGDVSAVHLAAIRHRPGDDLVGVCDIDPRTASVVPDVAYFDDVIAMVETTRPHCVHVCLPHDQHVPVTTQLVEMGVHVLCEKPVAHTITQTLELASLETARPGSAIGICLQNRCNATTRALQREINEHGLTVTGIRSTVAWHRPDAYFKERPWRGRMATAGGGVLINQAIHTLDLMQLLGGDVVSVSASTATLSGFDIDVEDTATAQLQFGSGATGLFFATNVNYRNDNIELAVSTDRGDYVIRDNMLFRRTGRSETFLAEDEQIPGSKSYYGPGHQTLIREFYEAIEQRTDQYVHVRDAVPVMVLIDAIRRSSEQHHSIPLDVAFKSPSEPTHGDPQ